MKKIILCALLAVAFAAFSGCAYYGKVKSNSRNIKAIELEADAIEEKVNDLGEMIGELDRMVASMYESAEGIETLADELKSAREELKQRLAHMNSMVPARKDVRGGRSGTDKR